MTSTNESIRMPGAQQIDLDRPRSIGEILAATGRLYQRYPILFVTLALAVMAPYELAVLAITGYGPLRDGHESAGVYWLLILLRTSLVTPLISALQVHAVVSVGEGQQPRLGAVASRGMRVLPVVAAASIMASLGIALGFLALIVPGILLALRWAVVAQSAAVEEHSWTEALASSRRLTAHHYWHIFGLLTVSGVASAAVSLGVRAIPLGSTSGVGSVSVGIVLDTVIASFSALILALLYFDLRARASEQPVADQEHRHAPDLD